MQDYSAHLSTPFSAATPFGRPNLASALLDVSYKYACGVCRNVRPAQLAFRKESEYPDGH